MKKMFIPDDIAAIHLNQRQIYQYFYEAEVTVGATSEKIPASAWKLSSRVKITGDSGTKYFIQVRVGAVEVQCASFFLTLFGSVKPSLAVIRGADWSTGRSFSSSLCSESVSMKSIPVFVIETSFLVFLQKSFSTPDSRS